MSALTLDAIREMTEKSRPKPRTLIEEALDQTPVLLLDADVDGMIAFRLAPGKAAFLTRHPFEIAGFLRREGFAVATGKDAMEIARSIIVAAGWPSVLARMGGL